MYSRTRESGKLTFLHSGKLWQDALVLVDEDTGSLWSQVTGEAIAGPLTGELLDRVPSVVTTWEQWRQEHPDTLVLPAKRSRRKLRMRFYPHTEAMLGILGSENPDSRLPGKTLVVGFLTGSEAIAVPLSRQARAQEARLEVGGRPLIVEHMGEGGPTRVWISSGRPSWEKRDEVAASIMYWFVWSSLHPDSRIVYPETAD